MGEIIEMDPGVSLKRKIKHTMKKTCRSWTVIVSSVL